MRVVLLLVLLVTASPALAETLSGRAKAVDGDTIRVAGIAVRLKGVAAPERSEAGGRDAAVWLGGLIDGRAVVCELMAERTWGRRVGWCSIGGLDLGEAVIAAGLARDCPRWSRRRYAGVERPEAARLPLPKYCQR